MAEAVAKLNEILSEEIACVWILREARFQCHDVRTIEIIQNILDGYDEICVELDNTIGALGGEPVDLLTASPLQNARGESLMANLKVVESAQQRIIAHIDTIVAGPGLEHYGELLLAIRQFHVDNIQWLAQALGVS